jgi:predicted dehydrogenase
MYVPYLKQEEPLKVECQHFLDCIRNGKTPLTNGQRGLELVRILEAASASLKQNGAAIDISTSRNAAFPTGASKTRTVREPALVCA